MAEHVEGLELAVGPVAWPDGAAEWGVEAGAEAVHLLRAQGSLCGDLGAAWCESAARHLERRGDLYLRAGFVPVRDSDAARAFVRGLAPGVRAGAEALDAAAFELKRAGKGIQANRAHLAGRGLWGVFEDISNV